MPQPIMNPNYFNPQYRTSMYGQFMPQQEQFQPQQFMQQPQQNTVLRNKLSALVTKIG